MQATAERIEVPPSTLAGELFAVMMYLLKSSARDQFRILGELDLSLTQIKLLYVLDETEDGMGLKELGEAVGLSLPAASRAVDGLHQRGLLERREHETDRRMKHVSATDSGRDVVRRINEARLTMLEDFAASLTDVQRRRISAALSPVLAREEVGACRAGGGR